MIERYEGYKAITLGIELAEMTIIEGEKSVIYFEELAKKHSENVILIPHWQKLGNVIKNWKANVKFHKDLKSGLELKKSRLIRNPVREDLNKA